MEVKREVKSYLIEFRCPKCNQADMVRKNLILTTHPPKYPHYCPSCSHELVLDKHYPFTQYEYIDQ
jgi:predicted RNA-binding Zn-ribbon protein involved in translation (DUF1610 family)